MLFRFFIKTVILLLLSQLSFAESLWVTDKLYLGLYEKPDQDSKRLTLMTSGTKVEFIEKKGRYKKVKTKNGTIGWAKAHLMLTEPTSALKLKDAEDELKALKTENEQLSNQIKQNAILETTIEESNKKHQQELAKLKKENSALLAKIANQLQPTENTPNATKQKGQVIVFDEVFLIILLAFIFVSFIVFFMIGRYTLEKQIRQKLHGYQIW